MMDFHCRSPSPPLHFPDIRSTPSPLRRRLPRPLPEPPTRLPNVGTWIAPYSPPLPPSEPCSRACSTCSDGSESVLAIIHEIDDALYYTNSVSRRLRKQQQRQHHQPRRVSPTPGYLHRCPPPAVLPLSPPRQRQVSTASTSSLRSASSTSSSSASFPFSSPLPESTPTAAHARTLRRKFSPRNESLREIRARDSEICLQRVYEREVMMYLDGSIFDVRRPLQEQDGDYDDGGGGGWGSSP